MTYLIEPMNRALSARNGNFGDRPGALARAGMSDAVGVRAKACGILKGDHAVIEKKGK